MINKKSTQVSENPRVFEFFVQWFGISIGLVLNVIDFKVSSLLLLIQHGPLGDLFVIFSVSEIAKLIFNINRLINGITLNYYFPNLVYRIMTVHKIRHGCTHMSIDAQH